MGIIIALGIIIAWVSNLFFSLHYTPVNITHPSYYASIIIQAFLYTGLFITAHDSMHGAISKNRKVNSILGWISCILYSGFIYSKLKKNHFEHHKYPAMDNDPDYSVPSQQFFVWYFRFIWRYINIWQLIIVAGLFNILLIWYSEIQLLSYYVAPALLSSLQLFYFGIYSPHKPPHTLEMAPYNSRTQNKNHLIAFLTCYFFGYHHEHHAHPNIAWWRLYRYKV